MSILKKPLITEKMTKLGEKLNQYGFIVDRNANKNEIKSAIESYYGVEVETINTLIARGDFRKNRRTGQISGRNPHIKKAIFTLKEGQKIDFFESI